MSEKSVLSGRLICDTQISAKELIKARSYDLYSLSEQVCSIIFLRILVKLFNFI